MDDPEDEESMLEIIRAMKRSSHDFKLFPSYLTFEVWILMHRTLIKEPLTKKVMAHKIKELFDLEVYRKGQKGFIARVLQDNLEDVIKAVKQAEEQHVMHDALGYRFEKDYKRMNPFTKVYALVEEIVLGLEAF